MVHLLNTTIIPAGPGRLVAHIESISIDEARAMLAGRWRSHVGHESTAALMSELLGVTVPMDRTPMQLPEVGEETTCLVMQVEGRPPEGKILTRSELEAIGVTWRRLTIRRVSA